MADNQFNKKEVQAKSKFRFYNPKDKKDAKLASHFNREANEIMSAPSTIFLLLDQKFDDLLGESTDPIYSEALPDIIGWYQPNPVDYQLEKWGLDAANIDMLIVFNKEEIDEKLSRSPQHGDLILDVHNRLFEVKYIRNDISFHFDYISEYVLCKRFLGDVPKLMGRLDTTPKETGVDD